MSSPHLTTPRHRLTISNRAAPRRSAILPPRPRPLPLPLRQVIRARHSKRARRREGREKTMAKDDAAIFASSSPRLCSAKPSPAAHYLTMSHHRQGGKGSPRPVLVVIPSPQPRHRPPSRAGHPFPLTLPTLHPSGVCGRIYRKV